MWIVLLLVAFVAIGLLPRRSPAREGRLVLGTTVVVVGFEAVSKHLL